jgi:hypothetical protein
MTMNMHFVGAIVGSLFGAAAVVPFIVSFVRAGVRGKR